MLKFVLLGVAVVIGAVLVYAATRPDTFKMARSIDIKASPEKIFPFISDFHNWPLWSPFELDPAMKKSFNATSSGTGAVYEWDGNWKVGAGRTEITRSTPCSEVAIKLDMVRPFNCSNDVLLTLEPRGDKTIVTWAMSGSVSYAGKLMGMLCSDRMIQKQFDEGLSKLKSISEKTVTGLVQK